MVLGFLGAACAGALMFIPSQVEGEEVTVSTYYPAPRGVYDELRANDMVFVPTARPATPANGMMYFDAADNSLYLYTETPPPADWRRFPMFTSRLLGVATLGSDLAITTDANPVDGLIITTLLPTRGLYAISWGGQVRVDAIDDPNRGALVRIQYKDRDIERFLLNDDDSPPVDGVFTVHDLDGGALVMLTEVNKDQRIRIRIKRQGNAAEAKVVAASGMWIKAELILPF